MPRKFFDSSPEPEVIALKSLSFLAEDSERLGRFLALSGVSPQSLKTQASEPSFLAGVLDYVISDEKLLLAFAESAGLKPESVTTARRKLPGGEIC